jgi:hypothetical protein
MLAVARRGAAKRVLENRDINDVAVAGRGEESVNARPHPLICDKMSHHSEEAA